MAKQRAPSALILPLGRWGFIKTQTNKYNSFEIPSFLGTRARIFALIKSGCHGCDFVPNRKKGGIKKMVNVSFDG